MRIGITVPSGSVLLHNVSVRWYPSRRSFLKCDSERSLRCLHSGGAHRRFLLKPFLRMVTSSMARRITRMINMQADGLFRCYYSGNKRAEFPSFRRIPSYPERHARARVKSGMATYKVFTRRCNNTFVLDDLSFMLCKMVSG
jgi:hypothetical protein